MPLKLYQRTRGGTWYVRGTVAKAPVNEATGTSDRARAEAYRARLEAKLWDRNFYGERAVVSLGEAVVRYLEEVQPGRGETPYVERIVGHFGETKLLREIDQAACDRMIGAIVKPGSGPATKRRVISVLEAILNHAARRKWCDRPSFVKPAPPKGKTTWLTPAQVQALLAAAAPHIRPLLHFLVCTGARMSEALELDWAQVDLSRAEAVFLETKNGTKRVAAIPSACIVTLANLPHRDGAVFRRPYRGGEGEGLSEEAWKIGTPYVDKGRVGGGQIKKGWRGACKRAGIADATPHDLRHTWATWFYGLSRDPLLLKAEGGWAQLKMIERYAHLMPAALAPQVSTVWGAHPAIRANSVQPLDTLAVSRETSVG